MKLKDWRLAIDGMSTLELVKVKNAIVCLESCPVFNAEFAITGMFELVHDINNELIKRANKYLVYRG